MRRLAPTLLVALLGCPPAPEPDAGMMMEVDSGPPPPACDSPEDCKAIGFPGVCRKGACAAHVPCADDLECGLGELCVGRECAFTGCMQDADCSTGHCRTESFACAECGANSDCPSNRPVCLLSTQKCVSCGADSDCAPPGPSHCETFSGTCQHCLTDAHCPNGLTCSGGKCVGAIVGALCPAGTSCAEGATCINLGGTQTCLKSCSVYSPQCSAGEICYALKYTDGVSYVFDMGGLLGVCYTPQPLRNYRDACSKDVKEVSNCQPSLACVPESSSGSICRAFCDPGAGNTCPSPELCHSFSGDYSGRKYGLCYPDNGYGAPCEADRECKPGLSCVPFDDPSAIDELAPACVFPVGSAPGLAPCADQHLLDGGLRPPDSVCKSGACRSDVFRGKPYFCFAACTQDGDCSIGARTGTCDLTTEFLGPTTRACRRITNATTCDLQGCLVLADGGCEGFPGDERTCRPGCLSSQTCDEYDAGQVCRPSLVRSSTNGGLKLNCTAPNLSTAQAGAPCSFNSQCRSGFCSVDDARGLARAGYCLEPCQNAAECTASDGGLASGPLDCLPTAYLVVPGAYSVRSVCSGQACVKDEDCSEDGGVRCAPDVSPLDAGALVLRCRPATTGVLQAGQSCSGDTQCASGACGQLGDDAGVCFQACAPSGPSPCPSPLSCRAGAFRLSTAAGGTAVLDGCAP